MQVPRSFSFSKAIPLVLAVAVIAACRGGSSDATSPSATDLVPTPAAPVISLNVNPMDVASGIAATLTWSSINAGSCTASGAWSGTKAASGTQSTGTLTTSRTYALTCTGDGGSASTAVTITVSTPPPPLGALIPTDPRKHS